MAAGIASSSKSVIDIAFTGTGSQVNLAMTFDRRLAWGKSLVLPPALGSFEIGSLKLRMDLF